MNQYERISLNILAWRSGNPATFPYSCYTCTDEMKKELNCDMTCPKDVLEDPDDEIILQTCPINYILSQHQDFLDKYWYIKEFPNTMPTYEECDKKFWEWYCTFKNKYTHYDIESQREAMRGNK